METPLRLFDLPDSAHDPGGKVHLALPVGMTGDATLSPCGRYRPLLTRTWANGAPVRAALWIGMNPSVADAHVNDPTVTREVGFTQRWGFNSYVKCNVSDYRAADPYDLVAVVRSGRPAQSPENLSTILREAKTAHRIIVCFGALHPILRPLGRTVVEALRDAGHALHCVGRTKDGSPRHPLYLPNVATLVPYEA